MDFKEFIVLFREKEKRMTEPQREHDRLVMSNIQLFNKNSTRHLSNNELWTLLNDIFTSIEYTSTFDKEGVYFDEEVSEFWNLRKSYDLRVDIFVNRIMDTKGRKLLEQSWKQNKS